MKNNNQAGIYRIACKESGKAYIGSSACLRKRYLTHIRTMRNGTHRNPKLQAAWNKYGEDSFIFESLIFCSIDNLWMYEQACINGFNSISNGYNLSPTVGGTRGYKYTDAQRLAASTSRRGRPMPPRSAEHRAALSAVNKGKKHSPETLKKQSDVKKGIKKPPRTAEHCASISKSRTGRNHTEASKAKMSSKRKGVPLTPEHRGKVTASLLGRVVSEATRAKISASQKGKKLSPEHIAALTAAQRIRRAKYTSQLDECKQYAIPNE